MKKKSAMEMIETSETSETSITYINSLQLPLYRERYDIGFALTR